MPDNIMLKSDAICDEMNTPIFFHFRFYSSYQLTVIYLINLLIKLFEDHASVYYHLS